MGASNRMDALARRYAWTLTGRVLAANYLMVATLAVYVLLLVPVYISGTDGGWTVRRTMIPGLPFLVTISLHFLFVGRRRWMRETRWLAEDRAPTSNELRALYSTPRRLASIPLTYWVLGTAWILPYYFVVLRFRPGIVPYVKAVVAIVFLAFLAWSLSYLLVERALRPIVARAMSDGTTAAPKTMSTVSRLVLAWAATSGVPIAGIGVTIAGLNSAETVSARTALFVICALGGLAGVVIATFSGRVIANPILKVTAGMRSIESGALDAEIPITETAEFGDLEIGFNRMASGLRERERMRDVFGRHVGAEVARRAMETELGVGGGERCQATAMFVDIIGSTALAQRRDPDAVVAILNRFFDAVVRVVALEGGLVNKFQGDGALCLFGTPLPCDDHAARGLRAARALATELAPMGDIAAAIGVSSGQVVAGNIGAADRYEFTVIGDAVNEAARLTEEAKMRTTHVLVSERTIRAAGTQDDGWTPGETVHLRGRREPTLTYTPAI